MLALVILVLVGGALAALDPNCTEVGAAGLVFATSAFGCQDRASAAVCAQLFNPDDEDPLAAAAAADTRYAACFQDTTASAPSEDVKRVAVSTCPNYCGFCCATAERNCANSPTPRLVCSTITQDMCQSTQWRELIAQDCPSACGFCLLGGCIDAAPDCASQPTICGNTALASFVQANCQRTCGLCSSSTTASSGSATTSAGSGTGTCGDANASCANWVRNGFCTSTFYSTTQKQQYCGQSCGLC